MWGSQRKVGSREPYDQWLDGSARGRSLGGWGKRHHLFEQLKHPVRQIRSDLDLALGDLDAGAPDDEDVEDLKESLKAALKHLRTMEYRMERLDPLAIGGRGRRISAVALRETLSPVVEAFEDELDRAGVVLDFAGTDTIRVETNPEVAQQILANLLTNALYWAPLGDAATPAVFLELTKRGFTISDTGPGIPEDDRRSIFEPHFTTREGAHGLGLTLVKDLAKTIGGRVKLADSTCARFEVTLGAAVK